MVRGATRKSQNSFSQYRMVWGGTPIMRAASRMLMRGSLFLSVISIVSANMVAPSESVCVCGGKKAIRVPAGQNRKTPSISAIFDVGVQVMAQHGRNKCPSPAWDGKKLQALPPAAEKPKHRKLLEI